MPLQVQPEGLRYLPIFLDLGGRLCLVLGSGAAAAAKVALLRRAGARVRLLAETLEAPLDMLAENGGIDWLKPAAMVDLAGVALIIDAASGAKWTAPWLEQARARGIPVNAVDRREACDFIFPAILDRSPVVIAISTGGAAPALARWLRQRLETAIPPGVARLAKLCGEWRERLHSLLPEPKSRQRFWNNVLEGPAAEVLLNGRGDITEAEMQRALVDAKQRAFRSRGSVDLVGAGPGATDLLTLRAAEAIKHADVILYDQLAGPDILALARREAKLIEVGKRAGGHSATQTEINHLLLAHALAGNRVVRLKGGDPFIFGRGGEELLFLRQHGVVVRVIPGITAALGCAASLGVPLTFRGISRGLHIVTGHRRGQEDAGNAEWARLAAAQGTLAIYMGRDRVGQLCGQMIVAGLSPQTPAMAIENGTLANERHCFADLCDLPAAVERFSSDQPLLLLIGEAVAMAGEMAAEPVTAAACGNGLKTLKRG